MENEFTLNALLLQEASYPRDNYSKEHTFLGQREEMGAWIYEVIRNFKLDSILANYALSYLDSCVSSQFVVVDNGIQGEIRSYNLCALSCLQIALKVHHVPFDIFTLQALSHHTFTADELFDNEIGILRALNWKVHPPTVICFLNEHKKFISFHLMNQNLFPGEHGSILESVMRNSRFIAEAMIFNEKFIKFRSSDIAYIALLDTIKHYPSLISLAHRIEHDHSLFELASLFKSLHVST